jgi:hypothetical protein
MRNTIFESRIYLFIYILNTVCDMFSEYDMGWDKLHSTFDDLFLIDEYLYPLLII